MENYLFFKGKVKNRRKIRFSVKMLKRATLPISFNLQ